MKRELPEFLIEMSEQMNNEDVRATAEPIWMVCYDKWLTCANDRGDKEILLLNDNGDYMECETDDQLKARIEAMCKSDKFIIEAIKKCDKWNTKRIKAGFEPWR